MTEKDALTKIDGRAAFIRTLAEQLTQADTFHTKLALLLVDINRLYRINDLYGYEVGDQILIKTTGLLQDVVREQDYLARIGDNTFALILNSVMNTGHAELAAHKLQRLLAVPFSLGEKRIPVDCTVAISLFPTHALNARYLLKQAEESLREAKQNHEPIIISRTATDDELSEYWDIEMELSQALEHDQLEVYYQPKVAIATGTVTGAEALLRWKHPERGFVSPGVFIPIAEKAGYMKRITNWVLNTALRQAAEWPDK